MQEIRKDKKNRIMSQHPEQDRRVNWKDAFRYYCTNMIDGTIATYADVAIKFGVSEETVGKIARRNDWQKKRERVGEKALDAFIKNKEKIAEKMCQEHFKAVTDLEIVTYNFIETLKQAQVELAKATNPKDKIIAIKMLSNLAFNLEKSANTIKIAQQLKRVLMGLPTEISKADIKSTVTEATITSDDVKKMDEFLALNAAKKQTAPASPTQ